MKHGGALEKDTEDPFLLGAGDGRDNLGTYVVTVKVELFLTRQGYALGSLMLNVIVANLCGL